MTNEMLREIVRFANENKAFMDGTTEPIYGIMDQAQIVFAVWKDETAAHGVGCRLVKCHKLLQHSIEAKRDLPDVFWTGVACECEEHAMTLDTAIRGTHADHTVNGGVIGILEAEELSRGAAPSALIGHGSLWV